MNDGNMYSSTASNGKLFNALVLKATSGTTIIGDTTLSGSNQDIYKLAAAGTATVDFDYQQVIASGDEAANNYGIVVTFTGQIENEPT